MPDEENGGWVATSIGYLGARGRGWTAEEALAAAEADYEARRALMESDGPQPSGS